MPHAVVTDDGRLWAVLHVPRDAIARPLDDGHMAVLRSTLEDILYEWARAVGHTDCRFFVRVDVILGKLKLFDEHADAQGIPTKLTDGTGPPRT